MSARIAAPLLASPFMRTLLLFIRGLITHEQGRCIYTDAQISCRHRPRSQDKPVALLTGVTVSQTAAVAGSGGIGYAAVAELIVGAFKDIAHIDITASRQMALAMVVTVLIHHFFPKGDQTN